MQLSFKTKDVSSVIVGFVDLIGIGVSVWTEIEVSSLFSWLDFLDIWRKLQVAPLYCIYDDL